LKADGEAERVSKDYEISCYTSDMKQVSAEEPIALGDQKVRIVNASVSGEAAEENVFYYGSPLTINLDVESDIDTETANFYIAIRRYDGVYAWTATSNYHLGADLRRKETVLPLRKGRAKVSLRLPECLLNSGIYYVSAGIEPRPEVKVSDYHDYKPRCCTFSVVRRDHLILQKIFDSPSIWALVQDKEIEMRLDVSDAAEMGSGETQ
jgi:hypothetical protein